MNVWKKRFPDCQHPEIKLFFSVSGSCVVRDASGNINDTLLISGSGVSDCLGIACKYGWNFSDCIANNTCTYGLSNNYQVPIIFIYVYIFFNIKAPVDIPADLLTLFRYIL